MYRAAAVLAFLLVAPCALARDCYEAHVVSPTPFMGNDGEIAKLDDGSLWEVKYEYEYMYEYNPTVIVCPGRGQLMVGGKSWDVVALGGGASRGDASGQVIEARIDGEFEGWEGETIVKLTNGQIWQQMDGRYKYKYKYSPKVLLIKRGSGYEMRVEDVDVGVRVERLR